MRTVRFIFIDLWILAISTLLRAVHVYRPELVIVESDAAFEIAHETAENEGGRVFVSDMCACAEYLADNNLLIILARNEIRKNPPPFRPKKIVVLRRPTKDDEQWATCLPWIFQVCCLG